MGSGETAEGAAPASDRTGVPHCSPSASERLSKRGAPSSSIFIYRWDKRTGTAVWRWLHLSFFPCGQDVSGTYVLRAAGEGRRPDAAPPLSTSRPEAYRGGPGPPVRHKAPHPRPGPALVGGVTSVGGIETSALSVIGIPVISYLGNLCYFQLGLGCIRVRVVVAFFMLPRYGDGEIVTAYAYLGKRFGTSTQTTAGVTFLITRPLADGIRVLAAAIPRRSSSTAREWTSADSRSP